jgi:phosphatidylserine/phosphatidylglycerophosphate/cardiolipin synthase-like enzyme
MFDALHKLTMTGLRDLAAMSRQCPGLHPLSTHALQQLAGIELGEALARELQSLLAQGWRTEQIATVAEAVADTRRREPSLDQVLDLVLSGPDAPGICTRDTAAVMHALLAEAKQEVLLVGYTIHNATPLFEPLARRLAAEPGLRVWCCLDIGRPYNDTSLSSEIVRRFAQDFTTRHWPWTPRPEVYFDPRSLDPPGPHRSSLHAKCIVVDRLAALVTSANFTSAAQDRNIEVGLIVRHPATVGRLASYFETLCATQQLVPCDLPRDGL